MFFNKHKAVVKHACSVDLEGYQILTHMSPGVKAGTSCIAFSTYVPTIGTLSFATTVEQNPELGLGDEKRFKEWRKKLAAFSDQLIKIKFGNSGIAMMAELVKKGKTLEEAIAAVNQEIQRTCAASGIILQPCGGYSIDSVAAVLGEGGAKRLSDKLLGKVEPQAEKPAAPAPASRNTDKKLN